MKKSFYSGLFFLVIMFGTRLVAIIVNDYNFLDVIITAIVAIGGFYVVYVIITVIVHVIKENYPTTMKDLYFTFNAFAASIMMFAGILFFLLNVWKDTEMYVVGVALIIISASYFSIIIDLESTKKGVTTKF